MMRKGYTLVSGAWDPISGTRPDIGGGPFLLDTPIAMNPDGSDIVGPSLEEFVVDDDRTSVERLTYPAASLDTGKAVLTLRSRPNEQPILVPADQWRYEADGGAVRLLPEGTNFKTGRTLRIGLSRKEAEGCRPGVRGYARSCGIPPLRQSGRCGASESARRYRAARLHGLRIAALSLHARLCCARVQRG